MLLKNLFRILGEYKFKLIVIIFFEILYLIKGYKGYKFNFRKDDFMADDIPCPYHFLVKMKKTLKENNFNKLLDLGCGSGRIIDFFDKNFPNKDFIGIEYFSNQYNYCKKKFLNNKNIQIIQADFSKEDFFQYDPDCYFLNNPFKKDLDCTKFIERTINSSSNKKKILFIFVNINKKIIENLNNIKCIENYYINETKGFSICCLNT